MIAVGAAAGRRLFWAAILALITVLPAAAVQPDEILPNPQLESRARALSAQLRCLVCRNETIDDSNASLARDLRLIVRERLQAGDSDRQILDFMVARYGRYILLKPPFWSSAVLLWLFPPLLFFAVAGYLLYAARSARGHQAAGGLPALTAAEEARLAALLGDDSGAPRPPGKKSALPPKSGEE